MEEGFLDIADFRDITGLALEDEEDIRMFNRANSRASRKLAQYLGWTPTYRAAYEEAAISKNQGVCPTEEQLAQWQEDPIEYDYFDEAETEVGTIKLFPYYPEDANYFIDPAVAVHSVKIVKVLSSDAQQFITVTKLAPDDWDQKTNIAFTVSRKPTIKWIEICNAPTSLPCKCEEGRSCYMLAIDGDWVKQLPDDLKYLLADLILFYMQHQPKLSADSTYAISSESVDGHSVSYNTNVKNASAKNTEDEVMEPYADMLKNFIGPYSILYVNKVRVS